MTELFQPGMHPDADQLAAFAEDALPLQERARTMTHLAACADCREVVFLAQQGIAEERPAALPATLLEPDRRPWLSGWRLVWAGSGALAAMLGLSALLLHRPAHPRAAAIAMAHAPETAASPPDVKRLEAPSPPHQQALQTLKEQAPNVAVAVQPPFSSATAMRQDALQAEAQPPVAKPTMPAAGTAMQPGEVHGSTAGGVIERSRSVEALRFTQPPPSFTPAQRALAGLAAAPPPTPATLARKDTQAGALTTSDANVAASVVENAGITLLPPTLPNHLHAVSTTGRGAAMISVDDAGTVWMSRDAGVHWLVVRAPWKGHAVRVTLIDEPLPRTRGLARAGERPAIAAAAPARSLPAYAARATAAEDASLTGVALDSSGATIPAATVRVQPVDQPAEIAATTDAAGAFRISALQAGRYRVSVAAPGFASLTQEVTIAKGQTTAISARLQVGASAGTVEVSAEPSAPQAAVKPELFAITLEDGAVWVSADGRAWRPR